MGPTNLPTGAPTPSPVIISSCVDTPLRLKILKDGVRISRYCEWVGNKATIMRCQLPGVSAACPVTCGSCASCVDPASGGSGLRFKFDKDGSFITRDCDWVATRSTNYRCGLTSDIC